MTGGTASGPMPWWQVPGPNGGGGAALDNLTKSAPPGYEYDPIKMSYVRTPTAAGERVNQYTNAASPALAGILGSIGSAAGGAGSSTGSASSATAGIAGAGGGGSYGSSSSASPGGSSGGPVQGGGNIPSIQMPDPAAATNAAFATAKDNAGKLARASLDSMNGILGSQGMLGSGAQVQGTRDIVSDAAGQVGQVSRDEAGKNADIAADFAKTNYGGAIAQRGQDVQSQEANARLGLAREQGNQRLSFEQTQLAQQRQLQLLQLALSGMKGGSAMPESLY